MEEFLLGLLGSVSTVTLLAIVAYLCRSWLIERLKASIKHEYDLKMLEVESQKEIRLKGEIVAELLAEWIRKGQKLDYHQLNKLSFQAFIWLPKDLAEELSNSLAQKPGSQDVRQLIKNIRTYLQDEDDGFKSKDVIVFNEPDIHSTFNVSQVSSQAVAKPKPRA
ncbi:hypothetical protein [Vibrio sp. B1-2]|uniref:hypothetical protein n=1 Tax=Vibrio sp. B1-2 TaxID=2591465 RepID=UPI0030DAB56E